MGSGGAATGCGFRAVSAAGEEVLALGFRFSGGASGHCNFPFPGNETEAEQVT